MNLQSFDLNLLKVLDALLRDASTTRAGERIGLSEPAVSAALGRLGAAFGDPLLSTRRESLLDKQKGVQGSQFTSVAWTDRLKRAGSRISMDERGRCIDNVFIERFWRSLKYECVYLHAWETGSQAKAGIGHWMTFYNHRRPHLTLGGTSPAMLYRRTINATQPAGAKSSLTNPENCPSDGE